MVTAPPWTDEEMVHTLPELSVREPPEEEVMKEPEGVLNVNEKEEKQRSGKERRGEERRGEERRGEERRGEERRGEERRGEVR